MRTKILSVLHILRDELKDPYYAGKPAELSFYFMMSLIPTVLLLTQLLATFSITTDILQELLADYLSEKGINVVQTFLESSHLGGVHVAFVVLALWGASKAQFALMGISNYAYTGNPRVGGYVLERLRAIKNSLLMLFLLLFGLILLVYGDIILKALFVFFGETFMRAVHQSFGSHLPLIWTAVRWLLGLVLYAFAVLYILYNAPSKKLKLHQVIPGSLVASVGMVVVTAAYSVYTNYTMQSSSFMDTVYGSFSSVIALLFWFFLIGSVFVIGILTNSSLQRLRIEDANGDDSFHV
ncbi:MAG: YihY/virulence factor BrkB family protein [Clostridia bacterium]|nr:YihY/virulence factor BrkB family protein [Clostridia bacterium]